MATLVVWAYWIKICDRFRRLRPGAALARLAAAADEEEAAEASEEEDDAAAEEEEDEEEDAEEDAEPFLAPPLARFRLAPPPLPSSSSS